MWLKSMGVAAVATAAVALAAGASAATVTWNVGSGQSGDNFVTSTGSIGGFDIELGLRTQLRQSGDFPPVGDVYTVRRGPQPGTTNRATWNFDVHVEYGGDIADLDSLSLDIVKTVNGVVTSESFDLLDTLLRSAIDCHTRVPACASGTPGTSGPDGNLSDGSPHAPDPVHFYQASQNMTFDPWSTALGFNFNDIGTYDFTLTAGQSLDSLSVDMTANVVPEPATMAVLGAGLLGLAAVRRRRSHA